MGSKHPESRRADRGVLSHARAGRAGVVRRAKSWRSMVTVGHDTVRFRAALFLVAARKPAQVSRVRRRAASCGTVSATVDQAVLDEDRWNVGAAGKETVQQHGGWGPDAGGSQAGSGTAPTRSERSGQATSESPRRDHPTGAETGDVARESCIRMDSRRKFLALTKCAIRRTRVKHLELMDFNV